MSYTKTDWTNNSGAKINATNLNKIENGIYNNDAAISAINTDMGELEDLTTTNKNNLVEAINEINTPYNIVTDGDEVRLNYKIDGKWVYAKRFTIPNLGTNVDIPHGLTNFEFIKWEASTLYGGTWRQLNYTVGTDLRYMINVDLTNINYNSNITLTGGTGKITLYYIYND